MSAVAASDSDDVDYTNEDIRLEDEQESSRKYTLIFYWVVCLAAVPLWWYSTSIVRLSIPETRVGDLSHRRLVFPLHISVDGDAATAQAVEAAFSARRQLAPQKWHHYAVNFGQKLDYDASGYRIRITPCDEACGPDGTHLAVSGRHLIYQKDSALTPTDVQRLVSALDELIIPPTSSLRAPFAPKYRVAISLLNEDSSLGGFVQNWDIERGIQRYLRPLLNEALGLYNFTIESHVQYHAPLAFDPPSVVLEDNRTIFELDQDQLKTFVNSAEWTLSSSVSEDIVLHLLLFVPSIEHRPMHVLKATGEHAASNAFVLPQWGGITIWNPPTSDAHSDDHARANHILNTTSLSPIFTTFRSHIHALLGVPSLPSGISRSSILPSASLRPDGVLSPWQLDALLRARILENVKGAEETLESIVKLVHQIQNMPVKANVRDSVVSALDALDALCPLYSSSSYSSCPPTESTSGLGLEEALLFSAEASTKASRAFFSPDMLAMLYFPTEHTFAVYTPLFLPIAVPLLVLSLKEWQVWRKRRGGGAGKSSGSVVSSVLARFRPKTKTE